MPPSVSSSTRLLVLFVLVLTGCGSYKQNIMFRAPDDFKGSTIPAMTQAAGKNYIIAVDDYLTLEVFTNKGERIIDPNMELQKVNATGTGTTTRREVSYLVTTDGTVRLPMIGDVKLVGMTIREAELKLQASFDAYYKDCYVVLGFNNKRVTILGATGGQVIPLVNENVSLVEILALAKGFGSDGKAGNIKVIRGQEVFLVDLSTVEGLQKTNMIVEPGDIVYVEPVRKPFVEGFRDVGPLISLALSFVTLILLYANTR